MFYLGKDTIVAYAWEEDKRCEYLEVNEIIESTEFRKWTSTKGKNITESDLVFSPVRLQNSAMWSWRIKKITRNQGEVWET